MATTWPPSLTPWLCAPACCSEILHHPWELRYPILIIVPWRQLTRSFVTIHPIGSHSGSKVSTEIFFYIGHFVCFLFCLFQCSLVFPVPASVRTSLPALKHRGKRSSKGKDRKSEASSADNTIDTLDHLTQGLASLDIGQASPNHSSVTSTPVRGSKAEVCLSQEDVKKEPKKAESEQSQSEKNPQSPVSTFSRQHQ